MKINIVTKNRPFDTGFGLITYDMLKLVPIKAIHTVYGYHTALGLEMFDIPIHVALVEIEEYDHGNGD